jgi:hypothetical protein
VALLGVAAASPFAALAQQPMPVIGWLSSLSPESDAVDATGFRQGLNETGYFEGRNVAIEYRWAKGQYDRLPALVTDMVRRQVTVIVTSAPLRHSLPRRRPRRLRSSSPSALTRSSPASSPALTGRVATSQA